MTLPIKIDTQVNQNLKEHSQTVHSTPFFVKGEAELSMWVATDYNWSPLTSVERIIKELVTVRLI